MRVGLLASGLELDTDRQIAPLLNSRGTVSSAGLAWARRGSLRRQLGGNPRATLKYGLPHLLQAPQKRRRKLLPLTRAAHPLQEHRLYRRIWSHRQHWEGCALCPFRGGCSSRRGRCFPFRGDHSCHPESRAPSSAFNGTSGVPR